MRSQVKPRSPGRMQSTQLGTVRGQRSIVLCQTTQELCLPFQIRQQRGASAQSNDNGPLLHYGRGASSSSDFRFARNGHFFNGQGSAICSYSEATCILNVCPSCSVHFAKHRSQSGQAQLRVVDGLG